MQVLNHENSLTTADLYIKNRPDVLVCRVLGHIRYLFHIKSLDGVLPRMNQLYLHTEEVGNFLSSMRTVLWGEVVGNTRSVGDEVFDKQKSDTMLMQEVQRRMVYMLASESEQRHTL